MLRQQKTLAVDYTWEESIKQILPYSPLLSSQKTRWEGMGVVHYYSHHPAHETPEHHHNHHVLLIPLSRVRGIELTLSECRQRQQMTNGGIIITPANVSHSAVLKEGAEFIVLDLEPTFVARSAHESVEPDDVEVVAHFARADPLIYQIGLTLKTELTSDESVSRFYAESLFTALSAHLLRKYSKRQHRIREYEDGLPTYKLNQALEYIIEGNRFRPTNSINTCLLIVSLLLAVHQPETNVFPRI